MRVSALGFVAAATLLASGCVGPGDGGGQAGYAPPAPTQGGYYTAPAPQSGYAADRDYRPEPQAQERQLAANDRVYRGRDGRYYCRRSNGSTGMVVGGVIGGILGNIIAPGGSALLGTLLGVGGGAVAGKAIDKHDSAASCR
ncbi:MAG: hypothetical protein WC804_14785 [Sphingomonas sp.]|jgi:hypothetical protein|uniref:hypothetical protein n=1 Tax=Sphingomonas sp. TaxID=28214 RepID=UPI0035664035